MHLRKANLRWPANVLGVETTINREWQYLIRMQLSVVHSPELDRAKHPLVLEESRPEDFAVSGAGQECWTFPKWQDVIVCALLHKVFQIPDI